jgi:hypothetical protein
VSAMTARRVRRRCYRPSGRRAITFTENADHSDQGFVTCVPQGSQNDPHDERGGVEGILKVMAFEALQMERRRR